MGNPVDYAISHARLTLATLLFLLVAGFSAYLAIPKEAEPDVSIPIIYVNVTQRGISPEDAERIFEQYGRAANAEQQGARGLGLGLYLCRDIVERHGGRIRAESPGEDRGTTIWVWLPADGSGAPSERTQE